MISEVQWAVQIDTIKVGERHRRDLGDIDSLAESIATIGLINPITIDRDFNLVAGGRRLEALRRLGEKSVEVRIVEGLDDAASRLIAERDENTCRKDMTPSELYALGKALEALERPNAAERQRDAGIANLPGHESVSVETNSHAGRTKNVVAPAVGLSPAQWMRLKHIGDRAQEGDEAAVEVMEEIERGAQTVSGGYRSLRGGGKPKSESTKRPSRRGVEANTELIREMAAEGYRAQQIADRLDINPDYVRLLAKDADITLPDAVIGRRRRIDPDRVVGEGIAALEGIAMGFGLLSDEDIEGLDTRQLDGWATSLSNSMRSVNRLAKQLKEMTRD